MYPLAYAEERSREIISLIQPYCLRVEVAGSVRRKVPEVGDIEIVAIPAPSGVFQLREIVNSKWGTPRIGAFPSKYTMVRGLLNIDFFWASRETWGLCFFIRTGPKGFVSRALAHWKEITKGGMSDECILWKPKVPLFGQSSGYTKVETPEEADVFKVLQSKFVPPEKRYDQKRN